MVSSPTHCGHIIDKVFVSRPDLYMCLVVRSVLKTKHSAVILTCPQNACNLPSPHAKRKVKLYDLRSPNIDRLRYSLSVYKWGYLLQSNDVEYLNTQFLDIVSDIVFNSTPAKTVVLGPKDPLTTSVLKQRNRLKRRGQLDKADVLAEKIITLITNHRVHCLSTLSTAATKELWADTGNKTRNTRHDDGLAILHNPDAVNNYFAKIASKETMIQGT